MELQKKWFVYMDDHHEGPFSPDEIFQKQKAGSVSKDSYVWCEGMSDWQMLEQVNELKSALQQFQPAAPATPAKPTGTLTAKLEPTSSYNVRPKTPVAAKTETATPTVATTPRQKKPKSAITFLVGGIALLIVLGFGALAVLSRTSTEDTHSLIRPLLAKILDRAPILSPLFKLTPKIPEAKTEDLVDLEFAMIGNPDNGVKIAISLAHGDPNRPYFYVATNLPDKTKFDLYLIGNGETLLNRLSFSTQSTVTTKFGLGRTEVLLAVGGQPIPKGEYQVYVVESSDQDETIRAQINSFTANRVQTKTPAEVPTGTKFLFVRTFFVGGERDDTYLTRLKAFHEKVKQSAEREVQELRQYSDTLQLQYSALTADFGKISQAKKPTQAHKVAWAKTVATWQQINGQMDQTIQTWTKETLQNEFFYGKTYELIKSAYDAIHKLFNIESEYMSKPQDKDAFDIQHGKAVSEARDALDLLKKKVDTILNAPKTQNGLPTREGQ